MRCFWVGCCGMGVVFFTGCILYFFSCFGYAEERDGEAESGERKTGDVRVFVVWNVQNFLLEPRRDENGFLIPQKKDYKIQKMAEVLVSLGPDLVGLAEVGGDAEVEELCRMMGVVGAALKFRKVLDGPDKARKLAFLSREPIVADKSVGVVPFEFGGEICAIRRGIMDISLCLPSGRVVRFVGVHLKSQRKMDGFDPMSYRMSEAKEIYKHVKEDLDEDERQAVLLWGDFNALPNEPVFRIFEMGGLRAIRLLDKRGEEWTHYWEEGGVYSRFDYVLANVAGKRLIDLAGSKIACETEWREVSDHRPLVVRILWN
ncbi:MAG: endonuclease/exonuclease/phosphatase family protein [Chthoniobacterales bacterium]|nr:endonuclease/exonuclease/phosphatase family protein [Chthoniobacterales bacterium]